MADLLTHSVIKGDTLGALAQRYKTTVAEIMRLNPSIKDKNKIKIGADLVVQPGKMPETKAAGPKVGREGSGYVLSNKGGQSPRLVNPEAKQAGKAAAPTLGKKWTPGPPPKLAIPVMTDQAEAAPIVPTPPKEVSLMTKAHAWLDPVHVLSGHAGDTDFQPGMNDYAGTALMGLGAGGGALGEAAMRPGTPPAMPEPAAAGGISTGPMKPAGLGEANLPAPGSTPPYGSTGQPQYRPTPEMVQRFEKTAARNDNRAGPQSQFPKGSWEGSADTMYGQENVRQPEPTLEGTQGNPGPLSYKQAPLKTEKMVHAPEPLHVDASTMKTTKDWHQTLRQAGDNTVILDNAHDHGFSSDQVYVMPGTGGRQLTAPEIEKILDAHEPPVLTQGMASQVLKYLTGAAGVAVGGTAAKAGEVLDARARFGKQGSVTGATEGARPSGEIGGGSARTTVTNINSSQRLSQEDKYNKALAQQNPTDVGNIADRWAQFEKAEPEKAKQLSSAFHDALDRTTEENKPIVFKKIEGVLNHFGY